MPQIGFRAEGNDDLYVYIESADGGSSAVGMTSGDNNRLHVTPSIAPDVSPSTGSPMLVLDPRTGGTPGEGDIVLLPKGSGSVVIQSGTISQPGAISGVLQVDASAQGYYTSSKGTDGQILISSTAGIPAWAGLTGSSTVTVTPGANSITLTASGAGVVSTITGNIGGAISPTAGNINVLTANSTAKFVGSGSTETLDFGLTNLILGSSSPSITSATTSVGYGQDALNALVDGDSMTAIGYRALRVNTGGNSNTAVGALSLLALNSADPFGYNTAVGAAAGYRLTTNASYNSLIGPTAGGNYTGTESSNICINNAGVLGESNTLRIGTATGVGNQSLTKAYICGIDGVNVGSVAKVLTMASDQIGTASILAGANVTISPSANTITISATSSGGLTWNNVTGTTQALAVNNGYVANNAALVTMTLPVTAAFGTTISVAGGDSGLASGSWRIAQNASQSIAFGNQTTTIGAGGFLEATNQWDSISLLCVVANTKWTVVPGTQGNITLV